MSEPLITPPRGAVAEDPPPLSLDEVPSAEIAVHRQWAVGKSVVTVACVERPVPLWIDELMPTVLGGMNGLARRHLGLTVVHPGETVRSPTHWAQGFDGAAGGELVLGRHQVGFARPSELLACTTACRGATRAACEAVLGDIEVVPGFVARESEPSERALSAMLAHPQVSLIVVLAGLASFVVVLLARRPR